MSKFVAQENPHPPAESNYPLCPVCGRTCSELYRFADDDEIVCCENCFEKHIIKVDAWEYESEGHDYFFI